MAKIHVAPPFRFWFSYPVPALERLRHSHESAYQGSLTTVVSTNRV